jgi:cellulose biosynthesis protein BcsQ
MSDLPDPEKPAANLFAEPPPLPRIGVPRPPRILAIANQKGGVGKTTTAINLGTALAAIGEDVLIVDLDPQGNASTGLGIDRRSRRFSTYDVLTGEQPLRDAIVQTAVPRLHLAPSTLDLSGLELEIGQARDRAFRLRNALTPLKTPLPEQTNFTYVLVDCPPSLNLLTVNAMAAAHAILVPLQCEFFALEGLSQLLKTVDQVRGQLNPGLTIHGIVLTCTTRATISPARSSPTCANSWDRRSTIPSSRAMCACRKRPPTANPCWSTISSAVAAKPICGSRPK